MTQTTTADKKTCPRCGGLIEFQEGTVIATCTYCGISCRRTGEEYREHYMMELQYDIHALREVVMEQALKQLGAPSDVHEKGTIDSTDLTYWPFWIVRLHSRARYVGTQKRPDFGDKVRAKSYLMRNITIEEEESFNETNNILIPATNSMPPILQTYHIPIVRKKFHDWEYIVDRKGKTVEVEIPPEQAEEIARRQIDERFKREAKREVSKFTVWDYSDEVTGFFLLHTPIWRIRYQYGKRKYNAIVDGASGRVISMSFPRMLKHRTELLAISLLHGVVATILWVIALSLLDLGGVVLIVFQAIASLAVGFSIFALYILRKAISISIYKQEL
jgi:predicted RNA-binding Zn-ribbon protein involved in translation (DUF1610 family)